MEHYAKADYVSKDYYEKDEDIRRAVDFIVSDELKRIGNEEYLERLHHELIFKRLVYDTFGLERLYADKRADVC